jgi:hypothetical protein
MGLTLKNINSSTGRVRFFLFTLPDNIVAPTLTPSGSQVTGTTITINVGTWVGAEPITYQYKWLRNDVEINDETLVSYTITSADDGTVIKGQVKGVNVVGESVYITTSNQVNAIDTIIPNTSNIIPNISNIIPNQ